MVSNSLTQFKIWIYSQNELNIDIKIFQNIKMGFIFNVSILNLRLWYELQIRTESIQSYTITQHHSTRYTATIVHTVDAVSSHFIFIREH